MLLERHACLWVPNEMAEREIKKRKRQSNDVDAPNKKVAFDGANRGSIKVTVQDGDGLHPVLVSAPGLTTPAIPFKAYAKPQSAGQSNDAAPRPSTHNLLLHSSKHPRLDYTASPITLDENHSHYIAIFDPATNRLQITPAHHLSLRSTLRSEAEENDRDSQRRSVRQQREELGREFGTKKAKKAIADKTVNAIIKDTKGKGQKDDVQDAILESMTSAVPAKAENEDLEASLSSKPIPKPNLAAESVEDVYTFNTLIPPSDARLVPIKDWQDKTRADENIDFAHRFPASRVTTIGKSDDVLRLKALRYLNLLLEFHSALQTTARTGKKVPKKDVLSAKLSAWPEPLLDSVRRRFANPHNELPKWHMDNLFTHMCALSLYVDGWTTDMTSLKDDLRMENKDLALFFRELGCKVAAPTEREREIWGLNKAKASAARVARLRLPLDFPRPRSGRRR